MKFQIIPPGRAHGRRILLAAELQAVDRRAIDVLGVPGLALMENAGRHLACAVADRVPPGSRVAICVGSGNNGGDGSVAARHLLGWGYAVDLLLCATRRRLQGDAAVMLRAAETAGVPVRELDTVGEFAEHLPPTTLACVVDAVLGTGVRGEVGGVAAEAIAWMNAQGCPIIAADLPSGLCADTGRVLGDAVRATETVTFVASKLGHWLYPGPLYVGQLRVVDIGMPARALAGIPQREVLLDQALAPAFAPRSPDQHKGQAGHLLVVAGSPGHTGAARLTAEAALRAGAGLVSVALPAAAVALLAPALTEAMYLEAFAGPDPEAAAAHLAAEVTGRDAVVLGPGMPTDAHAQATLQALLPHLDRPAVLDADALNHLAGEPERLRHLAAAVITPHPGEAGRLLGRTTAEIQADRVGAVQALAQRSGAVAVLKGAHTLIADPAGALWICPEGNAGMATAGMGDVLAGLIGALLARGLSPLDAARAGVLWHARAGDMAAARRTPTSLLARDVIEALADVERSWYR